MKHLSRAPLALAVSFVLSQSVLAYSLEPVDASLYSSKAKRGAVHEETRRLTLPMRPLPAVFDAKSVDVEAAARAHLVQSMANRAPNKMASEEFVLHSVSPLSNGSNIVQFTRRINGIEVFREDVGLLMNPAKTLVAFRGRGSLPGDNAKALPAFTLGSQDAVAAALSAYGFSANVAKSGFAPARVKGDYEWFQPTTLLKSMAGPVMREPARAKAVYFPHATAGLIPAWYVETQVEAEPGTSAEYYAHVISAVDGSVLFRHFQQADGGTAFSYRVWGENTVLKTPQPSPFGRNDIPHPVGSPSPEPAYVLQTDISLENAPYSAGDDWLVGSATETTGNNVDSYADLVEPNGFTIGGDLRATTTAAGQFHHTYDTAQPPASTTQRMASITNQFYVVNWLHDSWYDAGFKEIDGNAQLSNFGRGGEENDRFLAEAQDFSGANNANMQTPADGASPRMQMFVFNGPTGVTSFQVNPIAGPSFAHGTASFGAQAFNYNAGFLRAAPLDGCATFTNPVQMAGKIAFIDRGGCSFDAKVFNAQVAGAVGAIIGNVAGSPNPTVPANMGPNTPPQAGITIGAMSVNFADGETIRGILGDVTPDTATMSRPAVVQRDGTIDGSIMAHEWGHYISGRLVGNAAGLTNNQGRSMGEGWGDFTAMMMMVKEEDRAGGSQPDYSDTYGVATYAPADNYHGIRRYPYSRDLTKNPLTFAHVSDANPLPALPVPGPFGSGAPNAEVHNAGEVWAQALWQCYSELLTATPAGQANFEATQARMKEYVVGGYKLTPSAPTFLEARDAVMATIYAESLPDFQLCAAAFASRGWGVLAVDAPRDSTDHVGAIADTSSGADLTASNEVVDDSAACDNDGYIDLNETGTVQVDVKNRGWASLATGTLTIATNHPGLAFTGSNPATLAASAPYETQTITLPVLLNSLPASGVIQFTATPNGAIAAPPGNAVSMFARVGVNELAASSATERFDANNIGWTTQLAAGATTDFNWTQTPLDATGDRVAHGPDIGAAGLTSYVSPSFQVGAGAFSITLTHRYQFEFGDPNVPTDTTRWDGGVIEISTDGGSNWTSIGAATYDGAIDGNSGNPLQGQLTYSGTSTGYPATMVDTINLGVLYANQAVKLRFSIGTDGAAGAAGWDVHSVALTGAVGTPFADIVPELLPCGEGIFANSFE